MERTAAWLCIYRDTIMTPIRTGILKSLARSLALLARPNLLPVGRQVPPATLARYKVVFVLAPCPSWSRDSVRYQPPRSIYNFVNTRQLDFSFQDESLRYVPNTYNMQILVCITRMHVSLSQSSLHNRVLCNIHKTACMRCPAKEEDYGAWVISDMVRNDNTWGGGVEAESPEPPVFMYF